MNDKTAHNTSKDEKQPHRVSFLLRLWSEDQTGRSNWRASLELPGTGKRIGFASLEQLFIYLTAMTESRIDSQETENKD